MGSQKIRAVIREERIGKTKAQKEMLNCSLLSRKSNILKHNSYMIPLLIKSQLWLQGIV